MKKLVSLGILITLLGGCNLNMSTSNKESSKTSSNVVISSSSKEESSSNSSSSNKDSSSFTSEDSSSSSYIESDWYEGNYYDNANLDLSDNALLLELRDLTTTTHTTIIKYNSLNNILYITDRSLTDSSKITLLYNHKEVNGTWDSGNTYNKEHVWPQSTGWDKSQTAGADVHHLRPEDPTLNSTRGSTPYGEVTNGKEAKMKTGEGSGCYYGGGYFEPKDVSKGDVARIIFYLLTRYSDADSKSITSVAQSMELLLEWNELDPVDDLERQRNKEGEKKQGNRNPFIDYPELANKIWG